MAQIGPPPHNDVRRTETRKKRYTGWKATIRSAVSGRLAGGELVAKPTQNNTRACLVQRDQNARKAVDRHVVARQQKLALIRRT